MVENYIYERKDTSSTKMNVYPNFELNRMLKNGTYRVIKNKFPILHSHSASTPKPYQAIAVADVSSKRHKFEIAYQNKYSAIDAASDKLPQAESTDIASALPTEVAPCSTFLDTLLDAMPMEAILELPPEVAPAIAVADLPQEETPVDVAPALPQEEAPEDFAPKLPQEKTPVDTDPALLQEEAPEDFAPELPQEETPVDVAPALPQEETPVDVAPALLQEEAPVDFAPELPQEETPVDTDPALPQEEASVDIVPHKWPEAEPVNMVLEPVMEAEAYGSTLKTQLGYADINVNMIVVESENHGQQSPIETNSSNPPPYINFTVFNRLGLSIKNLTNLLDSDEDFELNIIDCNSKDNSWDYVQSLTDSRIKSKIHFDKNLGPIYAANFALSRRKPNQFFITIDSDTFIKTKNWIARFMEIFAAFPQVGLLGVMRDNPYPRYLPQIIPRLNGSASYLELKNADINTQMDFIPGQLQCLSPKLIDEIGYWSEENGFGDAELSPRIVHYTDFKVGFVTTIEIDMTQKVKCGECMAKDFCMLNRSVNDCFSFSKKFNKNESFVEKNTWKFKQTFEELSAGTRTAYCASIHDPESIKNHIYNSEWANDNFYHYLINSN